MQKRTRAKFCNKVSSTSLLLISSISLLILPVQPALSQPEVEIFREDFEGVFPDDNDWEVGDLTLDNDEDYWGFTDFKANSGDKSGWCAQIGNKYVPTIVFTEQFEDGFGDGINGWSVGDSNPSGTTAYWDDVVFAFGGEGSDGDWKAYCAGNGYGGTAENPTYQDYMDAYITRTVNLVGYDDAYVEFYHKMPSTDIEETSVYDYGQVLVDSTELLRYETVETEWTYSEVWLTDYVGTTVDLTWNFHSDDTLVYEGWYIDYIWIFGLNVENNTDVHQYDDYMDAYMMKQIDLTGFSSATLSYYYWLDSEFDFDYLYAQTSTDGSTWNDEKSYTGNSGGWVQDTVDLTPYVGSSVYIRFLFFSDLTVNDYEGAYLDDIVVTAADDTDPTVSITSPTAGSQVKSSNLAVSWSGSDVGAGIDHYEVRVDGGSWISKGMATTHTFSGVSDGSHTVEVKAVDKGGNSDEDSVSLTVNTSLLLEPGWTDDIIIFVVIIMIIGTIVAVVVVVRRRKPPMPPPSPIMPR